MSRALALAAAVALFSGCYDGPTSESSVFDCYCTQQIADMLNQALEIATVQDEAIRADCEAFTSDEINRSSDERTDPAFYWLDARIVELESRIRDLEASAARCSPDPSD